MSRTFVARVVIGAAFLTLGWVAWTQTQTPPQLTLNKVKDDLFEIEGDGGNVAVLVTGEGMILSTINSIRTMTRLWRGQERNRAADQIHFQHPPPLRSQRRQREVFANGGDYFHSQCAQQHRRAQAAQRRRCSTGAPRFTQEMSVFLGGKEVRARYYGRGHTNGDAVIYFPSLRTLHTGDLMAGTSPLIDYAGGGSLIEWTKTLDETLKLDFDTVIPGHGAVTTKAGLIAYRNNVEKLRNRVSGLIHQGKSQDEIAKIMTAEYQWAPNSLNMQWSLPGMMTELK